VKWPAEGWFRIAESSDKIGREVNHGARASRSNAAEHAFVVDEGGLDEWCVCAMGSLIKLGRTFVKTLEHFAWCLLHFLVRGLSNAAQDAESEVQQASVTDLATPRDF
jgi:hypothetical protein